MKYNNIFAKRTEKMGASVIREILKVVNQPGVISLAGGIPAPESFPMDVIKKLCQKVLEKYGGNALQYDLSEGFTPLRKALIDYLAPKGIKASLTQITISCGSQGVLDNMGKIMIDKDDKIAVESPTYLGALQAFNPYEPQYISMQTDEDGLIPESLEQTLKNHRIKFIYLVPNFQNPTGRTITLSRRKKISQLIKKYDALLLEDDPYGELRYEGKLLPSIKSLAPQNVVYTSTLSKLFAPGLRIGFSVAPEPISNWLVLTKQGVDLHTSTFNQALAAEYISLGFMAKQIKKNIKLYQPRQKAMLSALEKYFPPGFRWSHPEGGMFIWVEGPKGFDAEKTYWQVVKNKVAYVPGKYFFANPNEGCNTMRLNFSMADEKTITKAIKILADVLKKEA